MESLVTQLAAVKASVREDDQVAVLSSIEETPKFCDSIPTVHVALDMFFGDMAAVLLDHERWQYTDTLDTNALYSKGKGKFKPLRGNHCGKLGHPKDHCFRKIAKQQHKDHANLVGATTSEDEEDDTSTLTHALTANIRDLSLSIQRSMYLMIVTIVSNISYVCLNTLPWVGVDNFYWLMDTRLIITIILVIF